MLRPLHIAVSSHRIAMVTAVLLTFASTPGQAQIKARMQHVRSGFWLSLGAGSGWDIPGTIVPTEVPDGVSAFLRAGGTLTPQVLYGFELLGRSDKKRNATQFRGNATLTMLIYPSSSGVFFVKGGIGPGIVGEGAGGGYQGTYTLGLGLTGGAGLDLPLAGNLHLTPSVDYVYQSFHIAPNLRSTHRLLLGTVGLTWH